MALQFPCRVQWGNSFECQSRSVIRSDRYYAGGDGAARRPSHHAKHMLSKGPAAAPRICEGGEMNVTQAPATCYFPTTGSPSHPIVRFLFDSAATQGCIFFTEFNLCQNYENKNFPPLCAQQNGCCFRRRLHRTWSVRTRDSR